MHSKISFFSFQQQRESSLITVQDDLEEGITEEKRVVIVLGIVNKQLSWHSVEFTEIYSHAFFSARIHPCDSASSFVIQGT